MFLARENELEFSKTYHCLRTGHHNWKSMSEFLITVFFSASNELDTVVQTKDKEIKNKEAETKLLKVKIAALEKKLENSLAENKELVSICDQLMDSK